MKLLRIEELNILDGSKHIFNDVLPGDKLYSGGLSFTEPNEISHADDNPEGTHIHDDCELFLIVQGKCVLEVDKENTLMKTGDIALIEPGEDHHIISDPKDPAIILWCHAK